MVHGWRRITLHEAIMLDPLSHRGAISPDPDLSTCHARGAIWLSGHGLHVGTMLQQQAMNRVAHSVSYDIIN